MKLIWGSSTTVTTPSFEKERNVRHDGGGDLIKKQIRNTFKTYNI